MNILHFDRGSLSSENFRIFCQALSIGGEAISGSFADALPTSDVLNPSIMIVVAHGAPSASEIETALEDGFYVIRIGISVAGPRCELSSAYTLGRVADFEWPNSAGDGLEGLGLAIANKLDAKERENPEILLASIVEYFKEKFMLDKQIAAYLLKVACANDSGQWTQELTRLTLLQFKDDSANDLLGMLNDRVWRAPP